jgi:inorganic pyrophosphatase
VASRNKYTYNKENDFFELTKVLSFRNLLFLLTLVLFRVQKAEDGDPLDVLVISDFPSFPGCVVETRVIGVIVAEQMEKKQKPVRNDRLIAVASESLCYSNLKEMADLNENLLNEVIHFFEYYNQMAGKKFKFLQTKSSRAALKLITQSLNKKNKSWDN